ncbi:MAG TPA: prolyl oligopeptidase family serine peptidase, partial [Acidobacteriaceae bacterium]
MRALTPSALSLLLLAPALAAPSALGQAPRARIAALLDQLSTVRAIGPVALAPDAQTIAMVLAGTLTLQPVANPSAAQAPQLCPGTQAAEIRSLTWSPDQKHLAVLATCGQTTGVYTFDLPAVGGKIKPAHRLAELHGFAKSLDYAPDGQKLGLLYVEGASRPSGALAAMKPPSGVIGVEGLEIQRVASLDAATGKLQQLTPPDLHVYEFSWSPDSARIAYVAAPPPGENNWWIAKLYTGRAGTSLPAPGAPSHLVLDPSTVPGSLHGLQIAVPRWSPDGSHLAFIGGLMSDQGATGGDIYLVPSNGGSPVNLTPAIPSSPTWLHWQTNSSLQFAEVLSGASALARLTLAPDFSTARIEPPVFTLPETIGSGGLEMELSFARNGSAAMTRSSLNTPPEVWLWSPHAADHPFTRLTTLNADHKPSWGKLEARHWTNQGFRVDGWLLYPANYDPAKKYPLLVMVHGGPSSAVIPRWPSAGFGAAPFSALGYFVLEPNPRGSYGEGEAFTQANRRDFGYGDLSDILAGVDAVERSLPIDDHRLGLTGWSYGGFMT